MVSTYMGDLVEAEFAERMNRFKCTVVLHGKVLEVHLHDPGRLRELLLSGSKVLLRKEDAPHRKTNYDLVGVYAGKELVSCDSRVPNKLVMEALKEKAIPELPEYESIVSEYSFETSRIDFCLDQNILIEVKGVTLVKNGLALFPDAPTRRGKKHLEALISALKEGFQSYIFFVIQRPDAYQFSPNSNTDFAFAHTLNQAVKKGVNILVYTTEFVGSYMYLKERISLIEL
jgi:sugar fermentation stimulation protein A